MRQVLGVAGYIQLHKLVEEEYAKSTLDDNAFAGFASTKLGMRISRENVQKAREISNTAPNNPQHDTRVGQLITRVQKLEARILALEEIVTRPK